MLTFDSKPIMMVKRALFYFLCMLAIGVHAQNTGAPVLNIGDPAPPLYVEEWVKGAPIQQMEKGRIYVVEFWATWCKPCRAAMPHLSALARQYKDEITVVGVDVLEQENTPVERIRAFVDNMGKKMDYHVAIDAGNRMEEEWFNAAHGDGAGIPRSFVVDGDGRLAWIGHPSGLDEVIRKMVDGDWDIDQALADRNEARRLYELDNDLLFRLRYPPDYGKRGYVERPDSLLSVIAEIVEEEPKLRYAYSITYHTFKTLLKTDQVKAHQYGEEVLAAAEEPPYEAIFSTIRDYPEQSELIPEIYLLGAEAYQHRIDHLIYPEIADLTYDYNQMAEWYWRAGHQREAIAAQKKAVKALKRRTRVSATDLAEPRARLQSYKKTENR